MRALVFARRTAKEILRDPLSLGFGLGFPIALLLLMTAIQRHIPVSLFELSALTPGIIVFGLSFLALFTASLVAKDRGSSLIFRLRATPMTARDFVLGYLLPLFPMALCQMGATWLCALLLGLRWTPRILLALAVQLPMAVCFLAVGLICGSLCTERQATSLCGALLTNLSAWLSGAWFDLKLVGGVFQTIAYALPFANATDAGRIVLNQSGEPLLRPLLIELAYGVAGLILAVLICRRSLTRDL